MTDDHKIERDPIVEEARERLQEIATKLCTRIDPLDVGSSYLVIGMVLLAGQIGREGAGKYPNDRGTQSASLALSRHHGQGGRVNLWGLVGWGPAPKLNFYKPQQ